jgi:5-formyltetrahydrofolate cyclo-ligase
MVDRSSPIPAYYQIAVEIHQRIADGEWRAGDRIPPEVELAKEYQVSRMTMRKALGQLAEEGILNRKPGDGTFVKAGYLDFTDFSYQRQLENVMDDSRKNQLREQIWKKLRQVAYPDSRFHWDFREFVPDFQGSELCAEMIRDTEAYRNAEIIFVAPDNSLQSVRRAVLADRKTLLVASYAIRRGFFILEPGDVQRGKEAWAASLDGLERFGSEISLSDIQDLGQVDMMITGISLVTEKGTRWGKGHGFFDLEWAMFREIGVVDQDTPIVAVGHDCQVIDSELEPSPVDTVADWIVTPKGIRRVPRTYPKPEGIVWDFLTPELLTRIPPLQELMDLKMD